MRQISIEPNGVGLMRTSKPLRVFVYNGDGILHRVVVPVGYVFDGASIPSFAWWWIGHPFDPLFIEAACIHDWYCEKMVNYEDRVVGDAVFFALLARAGVPRWKRMAMYLAVRAHSWMWNRRWGASNLNTRVIGEQTKKRLEK